MSSEVIHFRSDTTVWEPFRYILIYIYIYIILYIHAITLFITISNLSWTVDQTVCKNGTMPCKRTNGWLWAIQYHRWNSASNEFGTHSGPVWIAKKLPWRRLMHMWTPCENYHEMTWKIKNYGSMWFANSCCAFPNLIFVNVFGLQKNNMHDMQSANNVCGQLLHWTIETIFVIASHDFRFFIQKLINFTTNASGWLPSLSWICPGRSGCSGGFYALKHWSKGNSFAT